MLGSIKEDVALTLGNEQPEPNVPSYIKSAVKLPSKFSVPV